MVSPVPTSDRQADLDAAAVPFTLTEGGQPRRLGQMPNISVIIPTRGSWNRAGAKPQRFLDQCLASLQQQELDLEIVLVVDDDTDTAYAEAWSDAFARFVIVHYSPPFNFSEKIRRGVERSTGQILVILNDDVTALDPGWLEQMVAVALESDVGAVGALLLYEDGTVQHAGHRYGEGGVHLIDVGKEVASGPRGRNGVDRDVTGVTAACLVQRRSVWDEVGGLDVRLPISFNDVEYCHRILAAGFRIVQCNSVRLQHAESKTRRAGAEPWEVELLRELVGAQTLETEDPLTPEPPEPRRLHWPVARYRIGRARDIFARDGVRGLGKQARRFLGGRGTAHSS